MVEIAHENPFDLVFSGKAIEYATECQFYVSMLEEIAKYLIKITKISMNCEDIEVSFKYKDYEVYDIDLPFNNDGKTFSAQNLWSALLQIQIEEAQKECERRNGK